ncbi:hypothetical protein C8R43DRAFT_1135716 [Mycena crocata]|nr:hypothetical protein C8R43DRAFT_1135716 [Mycena crocata]
MDKVEELFRPHLGKTEEDQQLINTISMRIIEHQFSRPIAPSAERTNISSSRSSRNSGEAQEDHPTSRTTSTASGKRADVLPSLRIVEVGFQNMGFTAGSQAFSSTNSSGSFTFCNTTAAYDLDRPPQISAPPKMGDIFFHTNTNKPTKRQVWLYNNKMEWEDISGGWEDGNLIVHPKFSERVLIFRDKTKTPNWVLKQTLQAMRRATSAGPRAASAAPQRQ